MKDYAKEVKRLYAEIERLENGKYTNLSIDAIISKIDWLWKWRKIDRETMETLSDRVVHYLDSPLSKTKDVWR